MWHYSARFIVFKVIATNSASVDWLLAAFQAQARENHVSGRHLGLVVRAGAAIPRIPAA
jgi:hypothetical protein